MDKEQVRAAHKAFISTDLPKQYQVKQPPKLGRSLLKHIAGWLLLDAFYPKPAFIRTQHEDKPLFTFKAERFGEKYEFTFNTGLVGAYAMFMSKLFKGNHDFVKNGIVSASPQGFVVVPPWAILQFLEQFGEIVREVQEAAEPLLDALCVVGVDDEEGSKDDKPTIH